MTSDDRLEKLRRSLLTAVRIIGASREGGWVGGSILADTAKDDLGVKPQNDEQAVSLIGDLQAWGLIEEQGQQVLGGERKSLRHRLFRLTKKGWSLWLQEIPPIPGIYDDRLD